MTIEGKTLEEFMEKFNLFLNSEKAKNIKGIVYIWKTTNKFARVKGSSEIIYIGQSKNTFNDRYQNSKSLNIEKLYFERYYKYMIEMYGAITIEIKDTNNPKLSEWEELMKYNDNHKEYPPLNRSIPNKPEVKI